MRIGAALGSVASFFLRIVFLILLSLSIKYQSHEE